jgi:hypothetical protein
MFHGGLKSVEQKSCFVQKTEQKQAETHKSKDTNFIQTCIIILPQK